jgi:hypothetical protein
MATVTAERCGHGEDAIYFDAPENRYIGLSGRWSSESPVRGIGIWRHAE